MKNLAPHIVRQRIIIECLTDHALTARQMIDYINCLSGVLDMTIINGPSVTFHKDYGYCCHAHWKESGVHMYSWTKEKFFTVDIYTCKAFDSQVAVEETEYFFADFLKELEWREI